MCLQELKSQSFVSILCLYIPERIGALACLILIAMMIVSVAERVVRRETVGSEDTVVGPGTMVTDSCSLKAIAGISQHAVANREI